MKNDLYIPNIKSGSMIMKTVLITCLYILVAVTSKSQIFKKVLNDVKNHAEWKVRSKAAQKTDAAIDSLLAAPQKTTEKKSKSKQTQAKQEASITSESKPEEEGT